MGGEGGHRRRQARCASACLVCPVRRHQIEPPVSEGTARALSHERAHVAPRGHRRGAAGVASATTGTAVVIGRAKSRRLCGRARVARSCVAVVFIQRGSGALAACTTHGVGRCRDKARRGRPKPATQRRGRTADAHESIAEHDPARLASHAIAFGACARRRGSVVHATSPLLLLVVWLAIVVVAAVGGAQTKKCAAQFSTSFFFRFSFFFEERPALPVWGLCRRSYRARAFFPCARLLRAWGPSP